MKKYTKEELYKMDAVELYRMVLRGDIIKKFPDGFWRTKESNIHAADCTKYLIENILNYNNEEIKEKNSLSLFRKNKLGGMLQYCFSNSPYKAIDNAYPDKFKEWEFEHVPKGYWNNKENGIKATKWLIEEKLKLSDDELKENLSTKLFKENGLGGMLDICFCSSPYETINAAYPNKFKEWEFKNVPNKYWNNRENGIKATKWLIEEKLKLSDDELKESLNVSLFKENGLGGMLQYSFNSSPYEAINSVYPGKFNKWELKVVSVGYWNIKEGIKSTKWLIEEKLKLTDEQLKEELSYKLFKDNGLAGMLQYCFNSSPYEAINSAYPDKFKQWEFKVVPVGYWSIEKGIEATKWLIEEKLKLTDEQLKEELSYKLFKDNGLAGMMDCVFNGSPYEAINNLYPGKYKAWEFKNVPVGYWRNKNNSSEATRWLIEEKLKLSDEDIKKYLSYKLFKDNGLVGMLQSAFNSSPYEAINSVYPNKFKQWELKCVPMNYWNDKENGIKAMKWLIEEKLKLTDEELKENMSFKLLKENGLSSMLQHCFNNDIYLAINSTYENKFKKTDLKIYK